MPQARQRIAEPRLTLAAYLYHSNKQQGQSKPNRSTDLDAVGIVSADSKATSVNILGNHMLELFFLDFIYHNFVIKKAFEVGMYFVCLFVSKEQN